MAICSDCGNKHGKSSGGFSTFQLMTCDWCKENKHCVPEYKYNLKDKDKTK